jgi:hypothetical protein
MGWYRVLRYRILNQEREKNVVDVKEASTFTSVEPWAVTQLSDWMSKHY